MISLHVNGRVYQVDVSNDTPLLWVLRDYLNLKGTKYSCGIGECGSCTVRVDGKAVRSCTISVGEVERKKIKTIEGLPENHPVKKAWVKEQVPQCGYCQPGVIMRVAVLLSQKPIPNADQIISKMDDVICRCGTYPYIKRGVETAIQIIRKGGKNYGNEEKDYLFERIYADSLPVLFIHQHSDLSDFKQCESWKRRVVRDMAACQLYDYSLGNG
jgi:isoquinoline 1-oxidoreductase alpha subunit